MPKFLIQASLHKWPVSFDDQAVRFEILETIDVETLHEAWKALDKLIEKQRNELEGEGFRTRIVWSEVKGVL